MKRLKSKMIGLAMLVIALLPSVLQAQDFTDKDTLRYVDGMHYRLINWAFDRTLKSRIPLEFYGNVRPTLWDVPVARPFVLPPTRVLSPCATTC